ncbi:adenine DNA glycosylase-like [Gigantopelta aegis]|uniref:adenine DNA glycosylase-like n=1 Tax=Gigantopelta aegis TaxID=1735272 RepID=UPI001B889C1B|nr:adenine DNA glycosylase-like [Gigantopelta aegis]XP_041359051.1 adenine DNA glycosylase-like [Gigantopelta aegis]
MMKEKSHCFTSDEVDIFRRNLLSWYDKNKRDLPWRKQVDNPDTDQRAYAVWVSEVMLQQTQVATVIDYYNKWMKRWPTLQDLALAQLEDVNEMWSGLGYYSRGRRLYEGTKKVVDKLEGRMPRTAADLMKTLPGVGRYTAGAIASIAFNQVTGVVDGNVIRVLARLRCIGADSSSQTTMDSFWSLANDSVDLERPGDFNQAVMELGATVCTPKNPSCSKCPLTAVCRAFKQTEDHKQQSARKLVKRDANKNKVLDIECCAEPCSLCLGKEEPWDSSLGVANYPRKAKKKAARIETTAVCLICQKNRHEPDKFFIVQRPTKGLLAGMWEFPSQIQPKDAPPPDMLCITNDKYGISVHNIKEKIPVGQVSHIFSHIHQTYTVEAVTIAGDDIDEQLIVDGTRWVTKQQFMEAAVSTAMKKVFKAYEKTVEDNKKGVKRKRQISGETTEKRKQTAILSFFKQTTS